jgi:hypothetical protein
MPLLHKELALGRWRELSLSQQMGNIGSEVSRASKWQGKDEKMFQDAALRGLELFDLTLADPRWRGRLTEIARAREVFCDVVWNESKEYGSSLKDLDKYFFDFALMAQSKRD